MKTLKLNFLSLTLLAMQGGDEPPIDRNKMFVESLGLNPEALAMLKDNTKPIADVIKHFSTGYKNLVMQSNKTAWDEANSAALIRTAQTGTHKALQGKLGKAFDFLNMTELQATEKPTAAIIAALAAKMEELKSNGDGSVNDLRQLLEASNLKNKGFTTELDELRIIKASIPDLKKKWTQDSESEIWLNSEKQKAFSSFKNLSKFADLATVEALLAPICDISVVVDQDGKRTHEIKDKQGALLKRTETDIYHSLAELMKDKVLVPRGFINQQNPPPGGGTPPGGGGNGVIKSNNWPTGGMSGIK